MNKKQFISELEKRLKILNENERKDIINEYSDIINEKVKNGETEEQAVLEFGNIDNLVREILNSYKINPDYDKSFGKKAKEVANNTEDYIKKGARKLADKTQDVIDDFKNSGNPLTLETVFEFVIKIFIFLILLAVLKVPFYFLNSIGDSIFGGIFEPFDVGFNVIWKIITWLLYVICVVIVGMIFFKKFFNIKLANNNTSVQKDEKIKEEKTTSNNESSNYSNVDTLHNEKSVEKNSSVLSIILKIVVAICIMFPIGSVVFGLFTATAVILYLVTLGVPFIGIFIILLGLSFGACWLFDLFHRLVFTRKKVHISLFFASLIVSIVGGVICASEVLSFDYYDGAPNYDYKTYNDTIKVENKLYINDIYDYQIIIDDEMTDDEVEIELNYYDKLMKVKSDKENGDIILNLELYQRKPKEYKDIADDVISDLKARKAYDYSYLVRGNVTVKTNSNTKDKVIIRDMDKKIIISD